MPASEHLRAVRAAPVVLLDVLFRRQLSLKALRLELSLEHRHLRANPRLGLLAGFALNEAGRALARSGLAYARFMLESRGTNQDRPACCIDVGERHSVIAQQ